MAKQKLFSRRNSAPARAKDEDLLKLRKPFSSMLASETGEQPSYVLPFSRGRGQEIVSSASGQTPTRRSVQYDEVPPMEVPPTEQPTGDVLGAQSSVSSIEGFLSKLNQSLYSPAQPSTEQMEYLYQTAGRDYPIASMPDGQYRYRSGFIGYPQSRPEPQPIQTLPDGSVLLDNGMTITRETANVLQGLRGLSQGLFGQQQTVTQPFGNYNPALEPGSGYNMGTDLRTRDLQNRNIYLPVDAEVVQVLQDDGTRWGDISGHMGYGNSVLLRLPTGEMIRLSHLSQLNVQPGQRVTAGTLIGTPGATGNTTGEHLDLEYYNAQGQIDNPENFSGFTQPGKIIQPQLAQQEQRPQQSPVQAEPQRQAPIIAQEAQKAIQAIPQAAQTVQQAVQPGSTQRQALGSIPEKAAQATGLQAEFGLGETIVGGQEAGKQARIEALAQQPYQYNPYRQLAGNAVERIGDVLGKPEGVISEAIAGGPTKRTNVALASEIGSETPQEVPGIRQNLKDIGTDIALKAGEGLKSLTRFFNPMSATGQARPAMDELAPNKAVGSQGASGEVLGVSSGAPQAATDTRDAFFRAGADKQYSGFMQSGAQSRGLSLDLFSPDFYQDPTRIASVFGNTQFQQGAEQKYQDYRAEEERKAREAQQNQPSLQDYLNRGKTAEQWYAETGRQSTLDAIRSQGGDIRGPGGGVSSGAGQNYTPGNANYSSPTGYASYVPAPRPNVQGVSSGPQQNYTPGNANYSSSSGNASYAPPPKSQQNPGIFSSVSNTIARLFRR